MILPIYKDAEQRTAVLGFCRGLERRLRDARYADEPLRVTVDDRDLRGGEKNWYHVKRGVPLRIEVGPRDLAAGTVSVARRDRPPRERNAVAHEQLAANAPALLAQMQDGLLQRARRFLADHTVAVASRAQLEAYFRDDESAGFATAPLSSAAEQDPACRELLGSLKLSLRCIPDHDHAGTCIFTGRDAPVAVIARAY